MEEKPGFLTAALTHEALMREMQITEEEIAKRKGFLEFDAEDIDRLRALNELARSYAD